MLALVTNSSGIIAGSGVINPVIDGLGIDVGAPPLWTPAEISTVAWYDATDSSTLTVATGVSQIDDKSGNGNHAVQASAASQPSTGVKTIGGLNALGFDSLQALEIPYSAAMNAPSSSVFIVAVFDGGTGARTLMAARGSDGVSGYDCRLTNGNDWIARISTDGLSLNFIGFTQAFVNQANMVSLVFSANSCDFYVDAEISASDAIIAFNTSEQIRIGGGRNEAASNLEFQGAISEMVFVSEAVSTASRLEIEGYLMHKYGLSENLPVSHPYKNGAPTIA